MQKSIRFVLIINGLFAIELLSNFCTAGDVPWKHDFSAAKVGVISESIAVVDDELAPGKKSLRLNWAPVEAPIIATSGDLLLAGPGTIRVWMRGETIDDVANGAGNALRLNATFVKQGAPNASFEASAVVDALPHSPYGKRPGENEYRIRMQPIPYAAGNEPAIYTVTLRPNWVWAHPIHKPTAWIYRIELEPYRFGRDRKPVEPVTTGLRVFTVGHSFHVWAADILADMANGAGIKGHENLGVSSLGGSRIIQHWDRPDAENSAKTALASGRVDVLTLSPFWMPDNGIEKFAKLAIERNPQTRITVQEFWLPNDIYDFGMRGLNDQTLKWDRDAVQPAELRKQHEPYFQRKDEIVRELNMELGREAVFVVPAGQAVILLREWIAQGKPGLKTQSELFSDLWGHGTAPLQALATYCHYAVIYRRSPVGLPVPSVLANSTNEVWKEPAINLLLQQIAWDAVTQHPLSGVTLPADSVGTKQ